MILFLDTDIILDFLAKREPFSKFAYRIFEEGGKGRFELWTSSNTVLKVYHLLEDQLGGKKAKEVLLSLLYRIKLLALNKSIFQLAAESDFTNLDVAIQYFCAANIDRIDCIVTRDIKQYQIGRIRIVGPEELFP